MIENQIVEIVDKTGKPRSDEDLQEAIDTVRTIMVQQPLVLPLFTIHAMDIMECLLELQAYRKLIAEIKLRKEKENGV